VDANGARITRFRDPGPQGYRRSDEPQDRDPIPVPGLVDVALDLRGLG
jgi:hypothetical protein